MAQSILIVEDDPAQLRYIETVVRNLGYATQCASNGEARRLIRGGGARINDQPVDSETREIGAGDLNADGVVKLSAGKKRHALIRPA